MSATADIQTRTEVNVLSVPLAAVTTREVNKENPVAKKTDEKSASTSDAKSTSVNDDLEEVVFVLDSSKVKKLRVKTAIQDLNYIQIIEGLKGNEEVITGPYNLLSKTLKEGDKVKVVSKDMLYEEKKKD
jgi:HlyD family secretion protein